MFGEIEVFILKQDLEETEQLVLQAEQNLLSIIAQRLSSFIERRRITSKLQQNEARTRAITDTARDAIIMMNSRGEVNFWNPGAEKMFGYTQEEIHGQDLHQLLFPEEFQGEFEKAFHSFQRSGTGKAANITMELRANCKNGNEIPVELSLGSVRIDDEWQVVGMMRDLTERKKADMERQQANKMESIGTLAAGIAHEINTPTQFVGNNLRFLQDSFSDITEVLVEVNGLIESSRECGDSNGELDALGEKVQQADLDFLVEEIPASIEQSQKGIETVSRIVGSMRAFTHPGKDEKTPSDLNRIIKDTIIVSRSEWKYDANIEIDLMESLPTVPCCPGAFGQIMLNLITNASHAIKSAHESSISSESSSEVKFAKGLIRITTTQQDQYAIIKISDDGTGIPEAIQKRIFDPFFTTKDVGQGTGQGLSLVHSVVVENLRGQIAFDTEQGKGTTFTINLPLESNLQEAHS
jgi:PAS domain S-box-containing protein